MADGGWQAGVGGEVMSRLAAERHRWNQASAVRSILSDGEWHLASELAEEAGWRFGGAILKVRTGSDGMDAWFIEKRRLNDSGSAWAYRYVGINPNPRRVETWKSKAQRLEAENRQLRARAQMMGVAL